MMVGTSAPSRVMRVANVAARYQRLLWELLAALVAAVGSHPRLGRPDARPCTGLFLDLHRARAAWHRCGTRHQQRSPIVVRPTNEGRVTGFRLCSDRQRLDSQGRGVTWCSGIVRAGGRRRKLECCRVGIWEGALTRESRLGAEVDGSAEQWVPCGLLQEAVYSWCVCF